MGSIGASFLISELDDGVLPTSILSGAFPLDKFLTKIKRNEHVLKETRPVWYTLNKDLFPQS
jgi:hypothetical protein